MPSSAAISGRTPNLYGTYLLTVQATDGAGNSSSAQAAFAWQNSVYTFTYDALDRLASAYGSQYSYDSVGRPNGGTDRWGDTLSFTQAAGHVHAVASVTRQLGPYFTTDSYAYDPDGNLTAASVASTGQAQTLAWDADYAAPLWGNRLISVTVAGGTTEQYVYDQDGQWAEKIAGSGSSAGYTFYVGPRYEVQVGAGETGVTQYYEFGGQRVAGELPGAMGTQSLEYLHADHLGSTLAATGSSGGLVGSQARYDAYGNDLYGTVGELPTDYDFTAQKLDGTGFYQMGARWYDPYLNQWIQPDSIVPDFSNPQSLNRYSYVLNNPLQYTDPTGHMECGEYCGGDGDGDSGDPSLGDGGSGDPSPAYVPAWDPQYSGDVAPQSQYEAVQAYAQLVSDPTYVAEQYATDSVSQADWFSLQTFAEYSELHTTADQLIIGAWVSRYGVEAGESLQRANMWAWIARAAGSPYRTGDVSISAAGVVALAGLGPSPNGMNGNPDHQATVDRLEQMAQEEFPDDSAYAIYRNRSLKGYVGEVDGAEIDRRPDVPVWDIETGEPLKVYEAARTDINGNFVPREQVKMYEYWEAGISNYFGEVRQSMPEFSYFGVWDDSLDQLQAIAGLGRFRFVVGSRRYQEPKALEFTQPAQIAPDLVGKPLVLHLWSDEYSLFPPRFDRHGEWFGIDTVRSGPTLSLTLPASFERDGRVSVGHGLVHCPNFWQNPDTGAHYGTPDKLRRAYADVRAVLRRETLVQRFLAAEGFNMRAVDWEPVVESYWIGRHAAATLDEGQTDIIVGWTGGGRWAEPRWATGAELSRTRKEAEALLKPPSVTYR